MLKTIDILARAKELTGKKFKCTKSLIDRDLVGKVVEIELFGNGQELYYGLKRNNHKVSDLTGFEEWEEVQEPVSFIEAVESNKLVRAEHPFIQSAIEDNLFTDFTRDVLRDGTSLKELLKILSDILPEDKLREVILNGKWYIKEDEK